MLSPDEVWTHYERLRGTIGTPAMAKIDRKMRPILAEMLTLGPKDKDHPAAKQFFAWLVDPQRTGEEFQYVIGPLKHSMEVSMYVGKIAAEALALRCPVLEDSWELAAWFLVSENYCSYVGDASDRLSSWIIHMIGDSNFCPNPYLRIELMNLFYLLVELNDHNRTQALESVLSACSSLNKDYLLENFLDHDVIHKMDTLRISEVLEMFANNAFLLEFDEKLSKKLLHVESLRLSSIVHNVSYKSVMNPIIYAQPMELHGLTAILKTITGLVQMEHQKLKENFIEEILYYDLPHIEINAGLLEMLIVNLKKSCQTPQLVGLTACCIMEILELSIFINMDSHGGLNSSDTLDSIDKLLEALFDNKGPLHVINSPVGIEINLKYKKRLNYLRWLLEVYNIFYTFSNIKAFILTLCHSFKEENLPVLSLKRKYNFS